MLRRPPRPPFEPHYVDVVAAGPDDGPVALLLTGQPTWSYLDRHLVPVLMSNGVPRRSRRENPLHPQIAAADDAAQERAAVAIIGWWAEDPTTSVGPSGWWAGPTGCGGHGGGSARMGP